MLRLLETRSLRAWVTLGMAIALVPLIASTIGGYVLLERGVIAPFDEVAWRQRAQIAPALHLRLILGESVSPVDEYIEEGDPVHLPEYRSLRQHIETGFASLLKAVQGDPATLDLLRRARADWAEADGHATDLLSAGPGDDGRGETLRRFHTSAAAARDKLAAVYDILARDIEVDHDAAVLAYERSIWLAGIAAGLSLLAVVLGALIVGRILSGSVDRLVDGAIRFGEGDRSHRIDVRVPPELNRVAEEFNRMIVRVHESETSLAELAHRDSLTGLANRRAFDAAFAELRARIRRVGEPAALLVIDIDRFKRVNDAYGHAAGDEVLRTVARTMGRSLRPFDKLFRIGGEEFAVLLPETSADAAGDVADRLRRAVAGAPVRVDGSEITAEVSIGAAPIGESTEQRTAMGAADAALYRAKASGRNRVVVSGATEGGNLSAA